MDSISKDIEACIKYLDDILMYGGNTKAEHPAIVENVIQHCVHYGLAVNLLKSKFNIHETIFQGHVSHGQKVNMDPAKLETMSMWPSLTKKKEVQTFFTFAKYY